jgi:hypothetical protein
MYWNFNIGVRLVILLLRGWSVLATEILMFFNMLHFQTNFIAKKISVWNMFLQNGTCAFPGSLYIDFIGHVI